MIRLIVFLSILIWLSTVSLVNAAFPTVVGNASSSETSDTTSHVVTLPASIAAGDLIIAFVGLDECPATATWPSPWVEIVDVCASSTPASFIAYLIASGGETTVTVTSSAAERSEHLSIRISAATWHGVTGPQVTTVTGNSANPNSPSLTPSWGAEDTLWITTFAVDDPATVFPVVAFPTNYGSNNLSNGTGDNSTAGVALATRNLNAATEDPGAFTIQSADDWVASTIAVRPAVAAVTKRVLQLLGVGR
jgi:hypothetical protein